MEGPKGYTTSYDPQAGETQLMTRLAPDVPEDVEQEYFQDHLNDPNWNYYTNKPASLSTFSLSNRKKYGTSEGDTESRYGYASSRAESRNSAGIEFEDESPYPEVRAAVSTVDDPEMPVNTFRMWFLGVVFTILTSFVNSLFSMRYPAIYITTIILQLLILPCGQFLAKILPTKVFNVFGFRWSFNPGPFTIKEHVCAVMMPSSIVYAFYITEVAISGHLYYNTPASFAFQFLSAFGSHTFGYGVAGLARRFVVWPSSMIWPSSLVSATLYNTLHLTYAPLGESAGHMSRQRFFLLATLIGTIWCFVPNYLFTGLSFFTWVCWIVPNNVPVNILFGGVHGLGMGLFTFDWAMISAIGSPLVTPWWAQVNVGISFVFFIWILLPGLYFTNVWFSAHFPISTTQAFDNTGMPYDALAILTDGVFDEAKYKAYSPIFLSASFALSYGLVFAALSALVVHTVLWFRKDLVRRLRTGIKDERDVHCRLMQAYPEVPDWCYMLSGLVSLLCLIIAVEIFPQSQLPVWGVFFGCALGAIFAIPLCMLQAITNMQLPIQVLFQLIIAYILPGRPMALMMFKSISFSAAGQSVVYAETLKQGHYMKIPPRLVLATNLIGSLIASLISAFFFTNIWTLVPDLCSDTQPNGYTCAFSKTFYTASVIWGGVGPQRVWGSGSPYSALYWLFLVGAVAPIPFYYLARKYPQAIWRYINIPVFFTATAFMPPVTGLNYSSWLITGFIFNYVVRRFHFRWWMRYNFIFSAALDSGLAIANILIFLFFALPKGGIQLEWWGNTVWTTTADALGTPLLPIPEGATIGPATW